VSGDAPGSAAGRLLTFIRFSHTLFALPFALGALFVASGGWPGFRLFALVLAAMVAARTAAMAFNRLVDWEIDRRNPRTEGRHRLVTKPLAWVVCIGSAIAFVVVAAAINRTCLWLSPVALFLIGFYSLTKRFTHTSHFFLGLALSASPAAAWIAATGRLDPAAFPLCLGVLLWVAGFDLIYATQDQAFDRQAGLHSIPVKLGAARSFRLARLLHLLAFVGFCAFAPVAGLTRWYPVALVGMAVALAYEHRIVRGLDPAAPDTGRVNTAFFHSNAVVGALFACGAILDSLTTP